MSKELRNLQNAVSAQADILRQKALSPTSPESAKVMDGGKELVFRLQEGKVVGTPPQWSWCLGWSWADIKKYFEAHRMRIVLSEPVA